MSVNKRGYSLEVHIKNKRHSKFRYWTNRKHKDEENIRRIRKILAAEEKLLQSTQHIR